MSRSPNSEVRNQGETKHREAAIESHRRVHNLIRANVAMSKVKINSLRPISSRDLTSKRPPCTRSQLLVSIPYL